MCEARGVGPCDRPPPSGPCCFLVGIVRAVEAGMLQRIATADLAALLSGVRGHWILVGLTQDLFAAGEI